MIVQEADLVVDGETYGCVKSFCYMGYNLGGNGGVELASTVVMKNR